MERLKRLREPAAVVALVGLGLHLFLHMLPAAGTPVPAYLFAGDLAYVLADPALLALPTLLVLACWSADPTPHARRLTVAALVLTAAVLVVAVGAGVAAALLTPTEEGISVAIPTWLPSLLPGAIAVGAQIALLRRPALERAAGSPAELAPAEPEPADPQQQPTWTPDAAVGTVWRRAGDAGSQTPATRWDDPGPTDGGWGPVARVDPAPEPTRRADD